MKRIFYSLPLAAMAMLLPGCGVIGEKAASMSIIYGCTAVLSFLLLIGYCGLVKKRDPWFLLLFTSVLVVNIGYYCLSASRNLEEALLANRIAYLGSVFLPMAMLMILLHVTDVKWWKWVPAVLLAIGICVFLVAASPGYLDIYYQEVTFAQINGVSMLQKVYGSWHCIYLFYLLGNFGAMIALTVYAMVKKKLDSPAQAVVLSAAVFVNLGVWLIEQIVKIDFEILSLSYIICEMFLLGLHMVMQEKEKTEAAPVQEIPVQPEPVIPQEPEAPPVPQIPAAVCEQFRNGVEALTKTERAVYECYLAGKSTKEILAELNIKENTLKFHNKNLYGKLGVSSRKQLLEIYKHMHME